MTDPRDDEREHERAEDDADRRLEALEAEEAAWSAYDMLTSVDNLTSQEQAPYPIEHAFQSLCTELDMLYWASGTDMACDPQGVVDAYDRLRTCIAIHMVDEREAARREGWDE